MFVGRTQLYLSTCTIVEDVEDPTFSEVIAGGVRNTVLCLEATSNKHVARRG